MIGEWWGMIGKNVEEECICGDHAMYPSGRWEGFWVQEYFGRQPMREFELCFANGNISGGGKDIIGRFSFSGAYDTRTGRVLMVKQYVGKHAVRYSGEPDGEGSIQGTWEITDLGVSSTGTFLLRPVVKRPTEDEPILSIGD
jgi:hypothetical protein